jgi:choline dehydrogenase-like flavoprotein
MSNSSFDVAVVGGGAGGCAAAAKLASAGLKVALIEEGKQYQPKDFKPNTIWALKNLYQQNGTRMMGGETPMLLPGGKGLGGSTLINSAICFRTPSEILEDWRVNLGCHTIDTAHFDELFRDLYTKLKIAPNPMAVQGKNNTVFHEGAQKLGLDGHFMPRNAPGCIGCGVCQYGCVSGGKLSADRALLAPAMATGDITLFTGWKAVSLDTHQGRATDLTIDNGTSTQVLRADQYVLSMGPIGSPTFIEKNGLSSSPHLGKHLTVHPTSGLVARYDRDIYPWRGVTQGYYVDNWQEGYLIQTFTVTPDQYYMVLQTPLGEETMEHMQNLHQIGSAGVLVHDTDSVGSVSVGLSGKPIIKYALGNHDRKTLIKGLYKTAEVFFAAGARMVSTGRRNQRMARTMKEFRQLLPLNTPTTELATYASHPMGTVRMGGDPEKSVVDPAGRLRPLTNVRVADASIFPTSLGVNPQVTTMALATMVAENLIHDTV